MRHRRWSFHAWRSVLLGMPAALLLSCGGGGGGDIVAPTTGAVEVTTSTTGAEPDPDGYTLTLDDVEIRSIGTAASAILTELSPGEHLIGLSGIAPNCTVQDGNPRTVTVTVGETVAEDIRVVCEAAPPATGGVSVSVATSGPSPDPDGYGVTVDGDAGRPIAANGNVAVPDLGAGNHLVGLGGVAANCTVEGDNPRTVEVIAGVVVPVEFSVDCGAIPPDAGTVTVTTVTSGAGEDPDGYGFTIGDGALQPIGPNATVSVANVASGAATVELSGVAPNCEVGGQNPRAITVRSPDRLDRRPRGPVRLYRDGGCRRAGGNRGECHPHHRRPDPGFACGAAGRDRRELRRPGPEPGQRHDHRGGNGGARVRRAVLGYHGKSQGHGHGTAGRRERPGDGDRPRELQRGRRGNPHAG
jgi:hypothetical protein